MNTTTLPRDLFNTPHAAHLRPLLRRLGFAGGLLGLGAAQTATLARQGLHWDQEMALFPWMLAHGWVLYRDIKDQHPPLLPTLLALLPDPGAAGPQLLATLGLTLLTLMLAALVAARSAGAGAGLIAAAWVALWLPVLGGAHLWYDLALGPCYLAALLLLPLIRRAPQAIWPAATLGLLLDTALLIKQQAILALLGGLAFLVLTVPRPALARVVGCALGAAALPLLASLVLFGAAGGLGDYVYWAGIYNLTSTYAQEGAAPVPPAEWPFLAALYAPVAAFVLGALLPGRNPGRRGLAPLLFAASLLGAATLAAWPRYDRFHLAGAAPLLAVIAGVAAPPLFIHLRRIVTRRAGWSWPRGLAWAGSLLLVGGLVLYGGREGFRNWRAVWQAAPSPLPYSTNITPLRAWVQQEVPAADDPILVYDLDPTLYRVVERLPPRPWTPFYPWILQGDSALAQWTAGVRAGAPRLALVTPQFVAGRRLPVPGLTDVERLLREHYVAGPHFKVQKYPDAGLQEVVGLIRTLP
jgi:hypothetical protein